MSRLVRPLPLRHVWWALLSGFLVAPAAQAQSLVSQPWQISVMASGVLPEDLRGLAPGAGGRLVLGVPLRPRASVEFNVFGLSASGENRRPSERTLGGGLDLRLESLGESLTFLFLAGGGYSQADRQRLGKVSAPYVNIGWGVERDLGERLALRAELRGMARYADGFIAGRGVTYDGVLSVGLGYRFGAAVPSRAAVSSTPPPPPPPVASVPVAPPFRPHIIRPAVPVPDEAAPILTAPPEAIPAIVDAPNCPPPQVDAKLDATGCLVPQRFVVPRARFFNHLNDTRVDADGEPTLLALASVLRRTPGMRLDIAVHTDSEGFADDNAKATTALAELLLRRLVTLGVDVRRVSTQGYGEQSPAASEDTPAGIEKNRRVVFTLTPP